MSKKLICGICKSFIIIPGEEYCQLIQYDKENKLYQEGWYHVSCFHKRYLQNKEVNQLTSKTMKLLEKVEGRLGI